MRPCCDVDGAIIARPSSRLAHRWTVTGQIAPHRKLSARGRLQRQLSGDRVGIIDAPARLPVALQRTVAVCAAVAVAALRAAAIGGRQVTDIRSQQRAGPIGIAAARLRLA